MYYNDGNAKVEANKDWGMHERIGGLKFVPDSVFLLQQMAMCQVFYLDEGKAKHATKTARVFFIWFCSRSISRQALCRAEETWRDSVFLGSRLLTPSSLFSRPFFLMRLWTKGCPSACGLDRAEPTARIRQWCRQWHASTLAHLRQPPVGAMRISCVGVVGPENDSNLSSIHAKACTCSSNSSSVNKVHNWNSAFLATLGCSWELGIRRLKCIQIFPC